MTSTAQKAEDYINKYLLAESTDILDTVFVEGFIAATGVSYRSYHYGAPKCQYLNRTLSRMYFEDKLNRWPFGVKFAETGFPKWVYQYSINHDFYNDEQTT